MGRILFNIKNMAIVAVFSLIAFVGFNSFKNLDTARDKQVVMQWFELKSTATNDKASALNENNYNLPVNSQPCGDGATYCGVYAENASGKPNLVGTTAETEIIDFFDNDIEGLNISAKD